jgi:hypothetical protein
VVRYTLARGDVVEGAPLRFHPHVGVAGKHGARDAPGKLRARLASNLKYLVVDEYQDVNPLQEELIRILHGLGANLCVVGDDDQTIYQWRGSEVENIIHFADRCPGVISVRLDDNFRSTKGIVMAARQVIERNPDRLPKKIKPQLSPHPLRRVFLFLPLRLAAPIWTPFCLPHFRPYQSAPTICPSKRPRIPRPPRLSS